MGVKTTFFNRDPEEEIYMSQPEGCAIPGGRVEYASLGNSFTILNKLLNSGMKSLIAQ